MESVRLLELFGGIGAPRCALRNLGIPVESVGYVEIDPKAVRSYNAMFPGMSPYEPQDVRTYHPFLLGSSLTQPDILVHGSPCQDFSVAGRRRGGDLGSDTRSSLMWESLRVIREFEDMRPRLVVWENVPNVMSKRMRPSFDAYLREMSGLGYTSSYAVLNALDFGLPQNRRRVFVVSVLGSRPFDFNGMRVRSVRPIQDFLENTDAPQYEVKQPSMLRRIGRGNGRFRGCVPVISQVAQTITTAQMRCPNSGVIKTAYGFRYLTELECWRLQGFSDVDYAAAARVNPGKEDCMNGVLYRQAGNSMPVAVLEELLYRCFTIEGLFGVPRSRIRYN